jgi:phosphoserine aminotransferase
MKKHNFSAGPSILPQPVFKEAAEAAINFNHLDLSILEISHRSKDFVAVLDETTQLTKELLNLGDDHDVLYLSGGASSQFFMVPMNYLEENQSACYLDTGTWSTKAIKEAKHFGQIHTVASSKDQNYNYVPKSYDVDPTAKYLHLTSNNTIFGTQLHALPDTDVPIVCDMSSDIMSRPLSIERYGIIYAGAQKNLGPAGVTLVIIRKDWAERAQRVIPTMLNYQTHIAKDSCFNTPPVFPIYVMMLNLRWLKKNGGLTGINQRNTQKSSLVYHEIDRNPLFSGAAAYEDRSKMNVTFLLNNADLDQAFLAMCTEAGVVNIKGHRSVGGFRASMYNAMGVEGAEALVEVMKSFEAKYG